MLPSRKAPRSADVQVDRISSTAAGYMELEGARKDGECRVVEVKNGVSGQLGCCNLYNPMKGAQLFNCANCEYFSQAKV